MQHIIHKQLISEHPLYQLFWECTLRCNLHCQHCGSDCRQMSATPEMPVDDFLTVLDSVSKRYNPHDVFVIITGGEPLMRDDLEECGRKIYDKGFPWGLVTNGLHLSQERFSSLLKAGMHTVAISLDGLEDSHNWMRGNKESFARVADAIDLLVNEPSIAFDVVTCVTQRNIDELPKLRDYLIGKGVRMWRLLTVFPVGRATENKQLQLSAPQFLQLMEFIKATRQKDDIHAEYGCEGFLGEYEFDVRDDAFFCKAGITAGSVLVDGSISACSSIRSDFHQGNIYQDDFLDVWENKFCVYRHRKWMHNGECADCSVWRYCNGNGMHLRDAEGRLLLCHHKQIAKGK